MELLNKFLPITVIAAISLFLIREIVDIIKKKRSRNRETRAFKSLLSEELERNYWTHKVIFKTLKQVNKYRSLYPATTFHLVYTHDGRVLYRCNKNSEYDGFSNGHVLVDIHDKIYEKILTDVAKLDSVLFDSMQVAYSSIRGLSGLRNTLISYIEKEEQDWSEHFDGWLEYAVELESEIYSNMNALYFKCAKTKLEEHRLD
ncbi:hypothetical protein Misp06_01798 [Microbulbifer sp. NBRC 101763]|uniref:hypothetical protein n=1 Tax=Microbulbifer sp. NBRC 101763 TaxID=1113820 RepID=UPI0030A165F2